MTFKIEKLPDEPIIICTMSEQFDPSTDYGAFWQQLGAVIKDTEAPIYRITHLLAKKFTFGDMTMAMAAEARSGMPGSVADPRIRAILVSEVALAQIAAASMKQEQYGQRDTPLFGTLDEALAYARQQLAQ